MMMALSTELISRHFLRRGKTLLVENKTALIEAIGLRKNFGSLGQSLLVLNVVLWPLIVALVAGLWCWRTARRVDRSRPEEN